MDISRADGSVIIVAEVNSSPAEKKLIQLEKTIEETAAKLDSKQKEKTGIEERLNAAKASALAAEEAVSKLRAEIARLNDREWIAAQGFTPQDYQTKVLDRMAPAAAELKEQETILKAQNDEVRRLSAAYQKVSNDCDGMTGKLARMKDEAGGLVDQIIQEREEARRANSAFGKAEDLVGRIAKRLKSLAKSALIFSVISAALTAMRKQFAATIRSNAEASAAFARLKGALLTFAAPILQDIIPALTWLMVSLYDDYAYEMPNRSQWEDVRDRSNVIIDIVHNAIFSYKLTVGDASAVRDYVEVAERVRLAANVEKAMAALLDGVPDGERDKMIEDRDKIGMMKDAEALPALEALRKGEWKA